MLRKLLSRNSSLTIIATGLFVVPPVAASDPPVGQSDARQYSPRILPASDEAERAIARFRLPPGTRAELVAAEPLLANPVAFTIDEHGRFYVAETYRIAAGAADNRNHMYWLDDELAARTVADRVALFRKHLGTRADEWTVEHERVRRLEDRDGDGKAEHSTVFADGFNDLADGIGAGLLARRGDVYFTCVPHLWLLRDRDADGIAEERKSLHHGYGVHVAFFGHDLHGLRFGPDGKLYFSIGDRGLNVTTSDGRHIEAPDTGSVLRCNPDGSRLELFATGLRNPQELAFDAFGNLFTCDNNSDSGDRARVVYVVEGGDSGWRIGFQYIEEPTSRGPWNAEKLWHPPHAGQPAYLNPPLTNLGDGPSGFAYYPGLGLPDRYTGHFFLCDFRGASFQSGIWSFAMKPKGAGFDVVDSHQFLWSTLATDVEFGPDSALYVTDWSEGWNKPGKGRIYRFVNPALSGSAVQAVKRLLADGFERRPTGELAQLIGHADMRVRQESQFALAERGAAAVPVFAAIASNPSNRLARLHAIWGLGQLQAQVPDAIHHLLPLLSDGDDEVRAQAAKVVGEGSVPSSSMRLIELLGDTSPRVRYFAALSLGKLRRRAAITPILAMLRANSDADPYLRHAGVQALAGIGDVPGTLHAVSHGDATTAERLAVVVALRVLREPAVARFLTDAEPQIVDEAARAIYDAPIPAALPDLADRLSQPSLSHATRIRTIAAAHRLGERTNALAVAAFAARESAPEALRIEALRALGQWPNPSGRDRVTGLWRPCQPRASDVAAGAATDSLRSILVRAPDAVRRAAAETAGRLAITQLGPTLHAVFGDTALSPRTRAEALRALERINDPALARAAAVAMTDAAPTVRIEGRRVFARLDAADAIKMLEKAFDEGTMEERQGSLQTLANLRHQDVDALFARWLKRLAAQQLPPEIQLDLLEAAENRNSQLLKKALAEFEASRSPSDPLAGFREAIAGGNAERGRDIFFKKAAAACLRCHKLGGVGGEVGPDLTGIGAKQSREYLLEAIVAPNKQVANGFETLVIATRDGKVLTGVVKEDSAKQVRLITSDGVSVTILKPEIDEQTRGPSAMPDDAVKQLTKSELRDLIEFLASQK